METLLIDNEHEQPAWFLLSLFLIVACYFRFDRLWSTRNIDLALLLLVAPSILFMEASQRYGHLWLLASGTALLIRLFVDGLLKRRPRLTQNLNLAGLSFLLAVFAIFQVAEILVPVHALQPAHEKSSSLSSETAQSQSVGSNARQDMQPAQSSANTTTSAQDLPHITSRAYAMQFLTATSQLLIIAALLAIGWQLFGDLSLGVSMATLYVLLPYTSFFATEFVQVLPAALVLGAILQFRYPLQSGMLMGVACGVFFFPVFLLPLWSIFYGSRNAARFTGSALLAWVGSCAALWFLPSGWDQFPAFGPTMLSFVGESDIGVWAGITSVWRMPVFALFIVMVGALCWWPRERTLEELIARSTAILIGIQFWNVQGAGIFPLWYVPLFLVVVFRPSLTHLAPPSAEGLTWLPTWKSSGEPRRPSPVPTESEQMKLSFR